MAKTGLGLSFGKKEGDKAEAKPAAKPYSGFGTKPTGPAPAEEVPTEIKNKTVKQVIEDLEKQLDEQVRRFESQARRIARWDRMIFDCLALMKHLEDQITAVEGAQQELQQQTRQLLTDQEDFLRELKEKTKTRPPQGSDQRQRLYRLAHQLGEQFLDMENQLREIVERTCGERQMESASDLEKIEQIANCHLGSMRWLMDQADQIEAKLKQIQQKLPKDDE
jgi:exonuclease VII large subunit